MLSSLIHPMLYRLPHGSEEGAEVPPMTLQALYDYLLLETQEPLTLHGNPMLPVCQLVHPRALKASDELVLLMDASALAVLTHPHAKVAIVAENLTLPEAHGLEGWVSAPRPRKLLASLSQCFNQPMHYVQGIHPTACIDATASVDATAHVGAYSVVGPHCKVDAGCVLFPHVTLGAEVTLASGCVLMSGVRVGDRSVLGHRVVIQPNAVIAGDGFSFVTQEASRAEQAKTGSPSLPNKEAKQQGHILRIHSLGRVVIGDDVEIGANTCVDRATLGDTYIASGTKIDNLVQVAHNAHIGEDCLIVGQTGIAGSCRIGKRVVIAGQTGMADHLTIGDDAIVMAKSGLMNDVEPKQVVAGIPAKPRRQAFTELALMGKLKSMYDEIRQLRSELDALKAT
jgi:UDP-3-O-[3-hydroxymyristoyl] glucosamine N-acyltransferase